MDKAVAASEQAGRDAKRRGEPITANPHTMTQGSPTRIMGIAWNKGWRRG